jgi:hypothetical protein
VQQSEKELVRAMTAWRAKVSAKNKPGVMAWVAAATGSGRCRAQERVKEKEGAKRMSGNSGLGCGDNQDAEKRRRKESESMAWSESVTRPSKREILPPERIVRAAAKSVRRLQACACEQRAA